MNIKIVHEILQRLTIGKLKIWFSRLQGYLNIVQFLMISWLVLKDNFNIYLLILSSIIAATFMYFDITYIYPRENQYAYSKSPQITQIQEDLKQIKERIKC